MLIYNKKKIILYYFLFISISVIFFLFEKNNIPGDFSISEYLINYSGGMTRRGFLGSVSIFLSVFFNLELRSVILFTQIILHLSFLFFLFKLLIRNLDNLKIIDFFCIFSPLFLIYPLSELEALGRKEILIFLSFVYLIYNQNKNLKNILIIYSFIVFPVMILTWELVVLFLPFFFFIFFLKIKAKNLNQVFFLFLVFVPSIFTFVFIWINPLSLESHKIMCKYIEFLDNGCGGASSMLVTATIYFDTLWIHDKANISNYLNYLIYFVVGFSSLFYFLQNSKCSFDGIFILNKFKNPILLFFFMYIPIPLIFIYGLDWGRWINIVFTLTYLFFIYLRESKFIGNTLFKKININTKFLFLLFFLICLSWHPRILLWERTGTFPIYRVINKLLKSIPKGFIAYKCYKTNLQQSFFLKTQGTLNKDDIDKKINNCLLNKKLAIKSSINKLDFLKTLKNF